MDKLAVGCSVNPSKLLAACLLNHSSLILVLKVAVEDLCNGTFDRAV